MFSAEETKQGGPKEAQNDVPNDKNHGRVSDSVSATPRVAIQLLLLNSYSCREHTSDYVRYCLGFENLLARLFV